MHIVKKCINCLLFYFSFSLPCVAQNVGINSTGSSPNPSAILDVDASPANNKGILIPRVTYAERIGSNFNPLPAPAPGLLVYQTDNEGDGEGFYYNLSSTTTPLWVKLPSSQEVWSRYGNAGTMPSSHFIGTTDSVDLVLKTNNNEVMRLTSNGNVGIGNPSPQAKLDVEGNLILNGGLIQASSRYILTGAGHTIYIPDDEITQAGIILVSIAGDNLPGSAIIHVYRKGTYNGAWLLAHDGQWCAGTTNQPTCSGYRVWIENNNAGARLVIKHMYPWCCRELRIYSFNP